MAEKSTGGDKVIDFDSAKHIHVVQRKEDKVQSMRQAFKAAREAHQPKPAKPKSSKGGRKKK
jgi:phage anti-repressor protein